MQESNKVANANKFTPQPGDKIICNNGKEFICCTLGNLRSKAIASHLDDKVGIIFGISEHWEKNCSWMYWQGNNSHSEHGWKIREVIPQSAEVTADKKEEVKEDSLYTVDEVFDAIFEVTQHLEIEIPWDYIDDVKEHLSRKNDPQYLEFLRLKAIYE